ncbi:DUF3122 domain-containing protein [Chroococcidiopsis sp. TS-821]|uniref:DUF3122 domain-containing protein n=1 Tax=Chroococcidiopsis sp. TS-821 TaxID=1378066 RepID=UPI000CEF2E40|nr:DUF3122 domain-containing protein [Chroococcidiopsis sp. TS-821]PPS43296.1 hypothetical protein B1A85_11375 [Chroococcidiopsis sp. TS-821]
MVHFSRKRRLLYRRFLQTLLWLLLLGIWTTIIFLGLGTFISQPVLAEINRIEAPGEILYRSQQRLQDSSGNSWQVILFKQVQSGQAPLVNLRLVGFPGVAELIHPHPLQITTSTGEILTANDVFLVEAPAPTIGQYDVKNILPQLPAESLQLSLPLAGDRSIDISVPQFVVQEWQEVAAAKA